MTENAEKKRGRGRPSDKKDAAVKLLREQIAKHGSEVAVHEVRKIYSNVARQTWNKWVHEAGCSAISVSCTKARKAARHLPAAPSPAYISARPVEARKGIDFMSRLEFLYDDAEKLRNWAVKQTENADGTQGEAIKNPTFFAQSIKLRSDLLENAVKTVQQFYNLQRMQRFYDTVLEEIAAESPEMAKRIIERLERLDAETGMTMNARMT